MSEEEGLEERRLSGRVEEILTGWWRPPGGKFQRCKTVDLGMHGALVVLDSPLAEQTEFELHLDMESNWSVALNAKALWQRPIFFGKQHLTAVSYRFQKPGDQSMFGLWLQRRLKQSGRGIGEARIPPRRPKQQRDFKPSIEPAPRVRIMESPWKKTLAQLTSKIPWFESDPLPNERRSEARGQVGLRIRCETEKGGFAADFLNVSLSGACIFVPSPGPKEPLYLPEKGDRIELIVPEHSLLLGGRHCTAEVVWSQKAGIEGNPITLGVVVGLRYSGTPRQTRKTFIGDLLRRINYQVRQVRSELRFPREISVAVEWADGRRMPGVTVDVSAGGAQIALPEPVETPSNTRITLELGDSEVSLSARLLRATVDKERLNCYAVAFRKGQSRERLELSRWLAGQMRVQDLDELIPNFTRAQVGESQDE